MLTSPGTAAYKAGEQSPTLLGPPCMQASPVLGGHVQQEDGAAAGGVSRVQQRHGPQVVLPQVAKLRKGGKPWRVVDRQTRRV